MEAVKQFFVLKKASMELQQFWRAYRNLLKKDKQDSKSLKTISTNQKF